MRFMHDGSPPLFVRNVRQNMNQTFGGQYVMDVREARSTGLHDPMTLTCGFLAVGVPKDIGVFRAEQ